MKYGKQKIWTDQEREALRIIKEEKQIKYYNKTPIKVETIEQYREYVTKKDEDNPEFNGKIFTSKKIGASYINKNTLDRHKYQDRFTEETYRTESGIKVALPTYYKQKIWTDQEREALRIIKEEKQVKYYNKTPIKVETIEQYKRICRRSKILAINQKA